VHRIGTEAHRGKSNMWCGLFREGGTCFRLNQEGKPFEPYPEGAGLCAGPSALFSEMKGSIGRSSRTTAPLIYPSKTFRRVIYGSPIRNPWQRCQSPGIIIIIAAYAVSCDWTARLFR